MKRLIATLILILCGSCVFAQDDELRSYAPVVIPKGAFFRVVNQRQITTVVADEGDICTFIAPADIWVGEMKIVPKSSIFEGVIEELHEPVQGINASLKIRITKIITPNKTEIPFSGYIVHNGSNLLGGELAPPLEYHKKPHYLYYPRVYKGVLQYVPGNKRFYGEHILIKAGAELIVETDEKFNALVSDF